MTTVEIEKTTELDEIDVDDLPIAHLPDDESFVEVVMGGRPTRALCGAPLLGITAEPPFLACDECHEIAVERWGQSA